MDISEIFPGVEITPEHIQQLLKGASLFSSCCFLDNGSYESPYHAHEWLLAFGEMDSFTLKSGDLTNLADSFIASNKGRWIFGNISYDLKQVIHGIKTEKPDSIGFPLLYFFVPQVCIHSTGGKIYMTVQDEKMDADILKKLVNAPVSSGRDISFGEIKLAPRMGREAYLEIIHKLKAHILRGDCYEINFCQEFFAHSPGADPLAIYLSLAQTSPNPFSCFYRVGPSHLMCASPERYMARRGDKIFSQPIKGTAPRDSNNTGADEEARKRLRNSSKELSENVMVVDLVRNDLSRICQKGSVKVDELFGIYSYPQVHQMVSTISGTLLNGTSFSEILNATFPMGSMTGAPKKRVMELIEKYEPSARGLFSGTVGYFSPEGDFDFNVVIRSLLYNSDSSYLSYQVGSGITWYSNAEEEFEECMLKASAIKKVLAG